MKKVNFFVRSIYCVIKNNKNTVNKKMKSLE